MIKLEQYSDKDLEGINISLGEDDIDGGCLEVRNHEGNYVITYFPPEIDQKENDCDPIELLQVME